MAWGAVHHDAATMTYYYAVNDRESKSRAFAYFLCCKKWLEYSPPGSGIDPCSVITDADPYIVTGFKSE